MTLRRYSKKHDNILKDIFVFISAHLQSSFSITSDLPDDHDTYDSLYPMNLSWSKLGRSSKPSTRT